MDELAERHRVAVLTVFGSAARRDPSARDLDVAVALRPGGKDVLALLDELSVLTGSDLAAQAGVIGPELAARLAPAAGLRNVLVHEYTEVDLQLVAALVPTALRDFSAYVAEVARAVSEP